MADRYTGGEPIAEVVRSGFVESVHRGSVAVLDAAGDLVAAVGDVANPVFPRSSNKPLQGLGMLRAGLSPATPADLALVCASHRGQAFHVEGVRALLRSAGLGPEALRCAPDRPLSDPAGPRDRLHHNCSGKHAGMVLTCLAAGWPVETYLDPEHPLQRALLATMEDLSGEPVAATGVDGCGAPVFTASLRGIAGAFLRLVCAPEGSRRRAVADAMRAHPDLVSGTDPLAYDTLLMRAHPGLLSKGGAEGVQVVAAPGVGAVAIKVDDGARRPLMPVLGEALRRLGMAPVVPEEAVLGGGRVVGGVRPIVP